MTRFFAFIIVLATILTARAASADDATALPDRVLGKADAPVTIEEYVSLTCSHCAEFYNTVLPELETKYVTTGKVKFILRDFPIDGVALKAAALARCMPEDEYYPFIKTLYANQMSWMGSANPDKALIQFARLGGLDADKAKSCLTDNKIMDAIVAAQSAASEKLKVEATPTFILNHGADTIKGAQNAAAFETAIDRLLATKN